MSFETKLVYSEPVMRRAVLGYWPRRLGRSVLIAIVALAALLVWSLLADQQTPTIGLGVMLTMSISAIPLLYLSLYITLLRQIRRVRELDGGNLVVDEAKFTVSSRVSTSTFDWSLVKEVWQLSGVWLLLFTKSQFLIIPTADVPAEMQAFILDRVQAAGGKIS